MKNLKTYCLALDLVPDPNLIDEYKKHHQNVWPEIIESIKSSGIEQMEIYQLENRLFMVIRALESFDFSKKAKSDKKILLFKNGKSLCGNTSRRFRGANLGKNGT